jgi:hypothetical protein
MRRTTTVVTSNLDYEEWDQSRAPSGHTGRGHSKQPRLVTDSTLIC